MISADIPDVLRLRDSWAQRLTDRGIIQWNPGEARLQVTSMSARGELWQRRSRTGEVTGTVAVTWSDPLWPDDATAGYIHLLMVSPSRRRTGLGDRILEWADHRIHGAGRRYTRLDAVADNDFLQRYYSSRGFTAVRTHRFEVPPNSSGHQRYDTVLFEKPLEAC